MKTINPNWNETLFHESGISRNLLSKPKSEHQRNGQGEAGQQFIGTFLLVGGQVDVDSSSKLTEDQKRNDTC